jgi:outer membrane protein assembly factor BamD
MKLNNIFLSILILILICASCSSDRPTGKTEAEVLYKEALDMMKDGRHILATERLNTLRSQYPYSFYSTHAELLQADILYEQENFSEAASAYIVFKDFHPKYQQLNYVIWRIAESFYNQLPGGFDKDLNSGVEATKYYEELIRLYPSSEFVPQAREKIVITSGLLLQREKYIADFYYKTKVYDAARFRYLLILDEFKDEDVLQHSMLRVVETSLKLGEKDQCLQYFEKYHEKFVASFLQKAENLKARCQ